MQNQYNQFQKKYICWNRRQNNSTLLISESSYINKRVWDRNVQSYSCSYSSFSSHYQKGLPPFARKPWMRSALTNAVSLSFNQDIKYYIASMIFLLAKQWHTISVETHRTESPRVDIYAMLRAILNNWKWRFPQQCGTTTELVLYILEPVIVTKKEKTVIQKII